MDQQGQQPQLSQVSQSHPPYMSSELQALIAALPSDLNIASPVPTSKTNSSFGDLSSTSSSCIFPPLNDMTALSMLSLSSGYPHILNNFAMMPFLSPSLPPHATIESLGLINSALYTQQRGLQTTMCSPVPSTIPPPQMQTDGRPRAFSSAATLQHSKPVPESERRRKRSRKAENSPPTTQTITMTNSSTPTTNTTTSVLRSLVESDDEEAYPNKVRTVTPMTVTREEEEMVRMKTEEILRRSAPPAPETCESFNEMERRPLRRLIRDEDLPDEVGPDSPFRHHPKYQQKPSSKLVMLQGIQAAVAALCIEAFKLEDKSEEEKAQLRSQNGPSLDDFIHETVRQELLVTAE